MEQLFTNCSADTTPQAIEKSFSITRIIYVLSHYSKWLTEQTNKSNLLRYQQLVYMNEDATDTINNKKKQITKQEKTNEGIYSWINNLSPTYSLTKLLDDFHYILFFHSSNNDFEMLTNYVRHKLMQNNKKDSNMDISLSIQLIRNNRSRFRYSQNSNLRVSTYCGYRENHDVITQQILDSIYCFLLFTFDVGYKLTSKQLAILDEIDEADVDNDDELFDQKLKYIKDTIYETKNEEKVNEEKEEKNGKNLNVFESGIKFDYWNENNSYYISPKHDTFKEEIVLFNIYCTLNNDQWNDILIKAQCLLQTNMAKILKASSYFANPYKIEHRSNISLQHIISLLLYTNFRKLRESLNHTYYATANDETNIIDRHSEFGHFGRILRESVELFGWQSDNSDAPSIYYFGFNKIYLFNSSIPYIYSPLLSSASMNVILLTNKKDKGEIISLRPYRQYLKYFDCAWIADDIGRDEKLFIGGQEPFIICNIYDIKLCVNYKRYVTAIDYFNNMTKAQVYLCDDEINEKIIVIINKLLNNKSVDIPSYIVALFECNRMSIDKININRYLMNTRQVEEDTFGYKALSRLFINNDKINSPNLNKYVKIFPNLTHITIQNDEQFVNGELDVVLATELFVGVFEFYKNVKNKLKIINIQNANQCQLKIEDCKQIFNQVGNKYNGVNLMIDIKKEINTISIISQQ